MVLPKIFYPHDGIEAYQKPCALWDWYGKPGDMYRVVPAANAKPNSMIITMAQMNIPVDVESSRGRVAPSMTASPPYEALGNP